MDNKVLIFSLVKIDLSVKKRDMATSFFELKGNRWLSSEIQKESFWSGNNKN